MYRNDAAAATPMLQDLGLNRVELTGAYHVNAFEKEQAYLKSYDPDRLLVGFREVAGLPATATIYPGWENTEIRGHTLGHYLTACSQAYAQNGNTALLDKLHDLVSELALCQLESGYLSAFPETLFDNVENRKPAWVPWYTMHKIIAGLIAVYRATRLQAAYDVVNRLGDWVADRTSRWSPELQATVLAVEYGGMNDCMYELYKLTGNKQHADAAHKFDELPLFEAVNNGQDILKGKHANTMIPKFIGALNRYLTLGESECFYLEAALSFWDMVVFHHSYITGGNSESEHFGEPDVLDAKRSDITCETCNSYNMLKLTRELFKLTRDVKYADYYENTYVNAILSSQNPETGMTMYFQPMATGYFKVYSSPFDHFWCCTGTGMESFTKLNDSIYFHSSRELYINPYIGSRVDWPEQALRIIQKADLPYSDTVQFTVETAEGRKTDFALCLRVPAWAEEGITVEMNGETVRPQVQDGYARLERNWKNGDTVAVRFPLKVTFSSLPDAPHVVGFKYGPVVLSAALGMEDMAESRTGVIVSIPTKRILVKDFIIPQGMSVQEWLDGLDRHFVRRGDELAFVLKNTDEDGRLVFTPHYRQHRERYGIYWRFAESGSPSLLEHMEKVRQEQLLREATIDSVQVGNDQYELEHKIQGELTHAGSFEGLNGRRAEPGGWFSYELRVQPGVKNGLLVTYGQYHRDRGMEVWVNGNLLATEILPGLWKRGFIEQVYEIPGDWIAEDGVARIKFVPTGALNGIYGILRTVKQ
jgi:uncharacterized protein